MLKGDYHPLIEILIGKLKNWWKTEVLGQVLPSNGE
jgi:hypothetical protein